MKAAAERALYEGAEALGVALDAGAAARIGRYLDVLGLWATRMRLTGERDVDTIVRRHVADSLAVAPLLPASGMVVDVGTGAGFPGMVLGCLRPDLSVVLLDSRRRRVSFLREAVRTVGLTHARAVEGRAEEIGRTPAFHRAADLVTARALRLDLFCKLAEPFLAAHGRAVAMQTAAAAEGAPAAAQAAGLRMVETRAYRLPWGPPRRLIVLALFPGKRERVP